MRLEHYQVRKLKSELLEIISNYLDLSEYKVFFYGSRVTGKGSDRSDVDVGIEGPEPVPGHILEKIRYEVDALPTMYTIEIVDFKSISEDFYRVAKQNVEILNE